MSYMPRWKQRKGRVFMRPFPLTLTLCGSFPSILSSPNLPQYTFRRLGRRRSRSLATPPSADERPQDAQVLPQHNGLPSPPARPPAPPPAPPSLARSSLFAQDKDRQSVSQSQEKRHFPRSPGISPFFGPSGVRQFPAFTLWLPN